MLEQRCGVLRHNLHLAAGEGLERVVASGKLHDTCRLPATVELLGDDPRDQLLLDRSPGADDESWRAGALSRPAGQLERGQP